MNIKYSEKQRQFLKMYGIDVRTGEFIDPDYRYVLFGGAIRGAKTIALFLLFSLYGIKYPGTRWTIVRKDLETIKRNTIPSWEKFSAEYDPDNKWFSPVQRSEWYVTIKPTGSKILFMGENIDKDPDLERFNGHESNGYGLEEANELSVDCRDKCMTRAGSWIVDPMPPAMVAMTCNPAPNWVKADYYDKHEKGELMAPHGYIFTSPFDNPFLPKEYLDRLGDMQDTRPYFYKRFVEGDWNVRDGDYFKTEMFTVKERHDMTNFTLALFGDIAYTASKHSDESAFGVAGINAVGDKHMFEDYGARMNEGDSIDWIIRKLIELEQRFERKVPAYIEAHSAYHHALKQEMKLRDKDYLVIELKHQGMRKEDRILSVRASLYRWSFDPQCQVLVNQFLDFNPDLIDSMLIDRADMAAYADRELLYDPNQITDVEFIPEMGTLERAVFDKIQQPAERDEWGLQ